MAFIYETYAEQKISAEANAMTEYIMKIRGIVPNYGNAFNLGSTGTILKIDQGMLVYTGRKAINNALEEIEVLPETLGTRTKYINVTLDGSQQPTPNSATFTISNTSAGSITSKTEDLMDNLVGSVSFELGTFTNTTSGIDNSSLQLTCPIILRRSLEELNDKFGNYLPLAGGTMSGTINGKAINATSFTNSGVTTLNSTLNVNASVNITGATAMKGLSTQGSNISAVGGKVYANAFGIQPPDGSQSTSAITWRDVNSMNFLKDVYGKYFSMTELVNSGVSTFNGVSNFNANANIDGNVNITGATAMKSLTTQGANISTFGGKVFSNSFGIQPPDGSQSTSAITWRDINSMNFLKDVYMNNKSLYMGGGSIETANGDISTGTGDTTTSKLTATSVQINSDVAGGFNSNVINTGVLNDLDGAEFFRATYANDNLMFRVGRNTANTNDTRENFMYWYDTVGSVSGALRVGSATTTGVIHQTPAGSYKLAYVNTSLNSALLMSNQMLLQNIETQQEMAFATPTIDFETINNLEMQKQTIIEQNEILEQEIIEIENELEEIKIEEVNDEAGTFSNID